MASPPVVVEVLRGDAVESTHRAHVVVADGDGHVYAHVGAPEAVTYLRSAAKPFQAAALVAAGAADALGVTDEELAVACGSHTGEPEHVRHVASLLQKADFAPDALRCGTHKFWSPAAKAAAQGRPSVLHNNCSGKHAAMLALQRHLGGDARAYLDPEAPAQRAILELLAQASGVPAADVRIAVDGCGAPTFALPLRAVARAFAQLAMPRRLPSGTARALARVARAMAARPDLVGGPGRLDTDLMGASEDRLVAKAGAEGVEAVGDLATGLGLAVKVEDGALRAVAPATVEALRQLAWLEGRALEVLGDWWMPPVTNHEGRVVGRLRPVVALTMAEGFVPVGH